MLLGKIDKSGISLTIFESQPLSYRIHDYLTQAIIKNEIKPRNRIRVMKI